MIEQRRRPDRGIVAVCVVYVVLAGGTGTLEIPVLAQARPGIEIQSVVRLDDRGEPVVGRPRWVSVDATGRFVIGDRSDRDIKVYSPTGTRVLTVGRAGSGPGEFGSLSANAILGDSIAGYDFGAGRLTLFDLDGTVSQTVRFDGLPPWTVRSAGDSTLLLVGHPARGGSLFRLAGLDGSVFREFLSLPERWRENQSMLQHMVLFADAFEGLVFGGMFGGDQLWVFNYEGSLLAAVPIDARQPLRPLDELVRDNGGRLRQPNGEWVHHGARMLMSVVATADSTVVLQIATYDATVGTDILDGGTILVLRYSGGVVDVVGRLEADWGLVGRDATGHALVMRYDSSDEDKYELGRIVISTKNSAPRN